MAYRLYDPYGAVLFAADGSYPCAHCTAPLVGDLVPARCGCVNHVGCPRAAWCPFDLGPFETADELAAFEGATDEGEPCRRKTDCPPPPLDERRGQW